MRGSFLEKPIAFHPALARLFGSINDAIYWQQLYYWSDKGKRSDGFVYKTKQEIEEETTLTRDQQDLCRRKLEERGFLETKLMRANGAPTLHYRVNLRLVEKTLTEERETHQLEERETHDSITENTQRIHISENEFSQEYRIEKDDDKPRTPKPPQLAEKVFTIFGEVIQRNPRNWRVNKTQRLAAENLFIERGEDQIRKALEVYKNHMDDEWCPAILSPFDLDSKWAKLLAFRDKYGN